MAKAHFKHKAKSAFTLIEIMVVLVIMGFLVSLVAPKLAGIVDSAVDTNCDTNQERLRKVLNVFVQQNNSLPNGLTNMVVVNNADTTALIPSINDGDKSNGAEVLSDEFADRYKPQVHYIDADEADELVGMGQRAVFTLQKTENAGAVSDTNPVIEENVRQTVAAGLPVMMAGVGINAAGDTATWSTGNKLSVAGSTVTEDTATQVAINDASLSTNANADSDFARMDEGRHVGRIVLGVSNTNELIHTGMLDESGTCPGEIQNADNFSWGNYLVLMPRLAATWERLQSVATNPMTNGELHAIALNVDTGEPAGGNTIARRTPPGGYPHFGPQEIKDFTTSCPEGHTWGAPADSFGISIK